METAMLENKLIMENDYSCFWKEFPKTYVQSKACEVCFGEDSKCPFYMPLCEMGEYLSKN